MESISTVEHVPSPKPYERTAETFKNQLRLFESRRGNEIFKEPADAIFGFAEFIRKESTSVLEHVRANQTGEPEKQREEYRLEQATAKLHEFNIANAAVLHGYAELLGSHSESVSSLVDTFPWLREISSWAESYVHK